MFLREVCSNSILWLWVCLFLFVLLSVLALHNLELCWRNLQLGIVLSSYLKVKDQSQRSLKVVLELHLLLVHICQGKLPMLCCSNNQTPKSQWLHTSNFYVTDQCKSFASHHALLQSLSQWSNLLHLATIPWRYPLLSVMEMRAEAGITCSELHHFCWHSTGKN